MIEIESVIENILKEVAEAIRIEHARWQEAGQEACAEDYVFAVSQWAESNMANPLRLMSKKPPSVLRQFLTDPMAPGDRLFSINYSCLHQVIHTVYSTSTDGLIPPEKCSCVATAKISDKEKPGQWTKKKS